jgi:ribosomal protein S27AE
MTTTTETKTTCPRCGSDLVIAIANQQHCNQCSLDFDFVKDPIGRKAGWRGLKPHVHG